MSVVAYEQVEEYMKTIGLKYIKNSQDFITGLAIRTDKKYAQDMAHELNSRAEGAPTDNRKFYELKNKSLEGSLFVSAAFDGGVFRHIGNLLIDNKNLLGKRVLDLCCDCGIVTCFMAKYFPEISFVGIDINESAIENARELAKRLGVSNAEFICADVYNLSFGEKFSAVTSFRGLLDAAEFETQGLPYIGFRDEREEKYKEAFSGYAKAVDSCLADDGVLISVERYTAEYGWLGWMTALAECGIYAGENCTIMRAQDISSTKEYSVTFADRKSETKPIDVFNAVLSKQFKSGTGYDGGMAEFALYYDSDGEIKFTDVLKKNRIVHQYAFATSKNGKRMYYDASGDKRKIKYYNEKKEDAMKKDYNRKLDLYDPEVYTVNKYTK